MSIKEKLMHISPWSLILLLYLMFILSGLLMRLFGNFLSVIMFLMVVVIVAFACEYVFDSIFKIHYQD
jgi:small neutral amino acid transporter SnatA (MarC family)